MNFAKTVNIFIAGKTGKGKIAKTVKIAKKAIKVILMDWNFRLIEK